MRHEEGVFLIVSRLVFQYRKRYEVTCDVTVIGKSVKFSSSFNTASGMRSHVTRLIVTGRQSRFRFQYRKRYEVTCDKAVTAFVAYKAAVSIPQAV